MRPHPAWTDDTLLLPGEVAELFRVDPKTATRWAHAGRIPDDPETGDRGVITTPGGHIRFRWGVIRRLRNGEIQLRYPSRWRTDEPDESVGQPVGHEGTVESDTPEETSYHGINHAQ